MKVSDVYKKIGKEILNTVVDRQNMLFVYEMEEDHYFTGINIQTYTKIL